MMSECGARERFSNLHDDECAALGRTQSIKPNNERKATVHLCGDSNVAE